MLWLTMSGGITGNFYLSLYHFVNVPSFLQRLLIL